MHDLSRPRLKRLDDDMEMFMRHMQFRFAQPDKAPTATYLRVEYRLRALAVPLGLLNTKFPMHQLLITRSLWRLVRVPGMWTFPLAGIVNEAVRRMRSEECYINVGTWRGFSLFAGMLGNEHKRCVGIDNFSQHTGPGRGDVREDFLRRFKSWRSPRHGFFEGDYVEYFASHHRGPIGVYLYDGHHSFENQLRGLEVAEPYFADGCLIFIDDAFSAEPRHATISFMNARPGSYEVVLDQPVATKGHPTYWNGILVIRRTSADPAI